MAIGIDLRDHGGGSGTRQLVVYTMCTLCTSLRDTYLHPMYSAATRDVRSARPGAELLRQGNRQTFALVSVSGRSKVQ